MSHLSLQRAQPLGHPMKKAADLLDCSTVPGDTHTQVTSSSCYMGDLTIKSLLDHPELLVEEFIGNLGKGTNSLMSRVHEVFSSFPTFNVQYNM